MRVSPEVTLNDLYVFMACATCATVKSTCCGILRQSASVELAVGCGIFAPRSCFGAPVLYAMSGDADNCRKALDATPARWTAFRTVLQKHFKVAPDLCFVQVLPCIWRHFVRYQKTHLRRFQLQDKFVQLQDSSSGFCSKSGFPGSPAIKWKDCSGSPQTTRCCSSCSGGFPALKQHWRSRTRSLCCGDTWSCSAAGESGSQSLGVELGLCSKTSSASLGFRCKCCWEQAIEEKLECCRRRRVQSALFGGRTTVDGCRPLSGRGADSVCPAPPLMAKLAHLIHRQGQKLALGAASASSCAGLSPRLAHQQGVRLRLPCGRSFAGMASRPLLGGQSCPQLAQGWRVDASTGFPMLKSGERLSPERGLGSCVRAKSGEWPYEMECRDSALAQARWAERGPCA